MGLFNLFSKKTNNIIKNKDIVKEIIFDDVAKQVLTKNQQKLKLLLEYFSQVAFL
jgi:hypothetical protein